MQHSEPTQEFVPEFSNIEKVKRMFTEELEKNLIFSETTNGTVIVKSNTNFFDFQQLARLISVSFMYNFVMDIYLDGISGYYQTVTARLIPKK